MPEPRLKIDRPRDFHFALPEKPLHFHTEAIALAAELLAAVVPRALVTAARDDLDLGVRLDALAQIVESTRFVKQHSNALAELVDGTPRLHPHNLN